MLKNYLKIAIRSLLKYKGYTVINILGLVVGITSCILIAVYVQSEMSYDRFHEKASQIYRINNLLKPPFGGHTYPHCNSALAVAVHDAAPGVLNYTRLSRFGNGFNNEVLVRINDKYYKENKVFTADASFFEVFSFRMLEGTPQSALTAPYSVVLSEATARRFFGDQPALGKTITFANNLEQDYEVAGIMENMPHNSHMHADILVSMSTLDALNPEADPKLDGNWTNDGFYAYLLLSPNQPPAEIETLMHELGTKNLDDQNVFRSNPSLIPLTDIHLHSNLLNEMEPNGSIAQLYVFGAVALFILLIAAINYMNLATARSARRSKEVGMRKTLGAQRLQLVIQFLSESVVLCLLATLISLLLAYWLLPAFAQLSGKELTLDLWQNPFLLVLLIGIIIGVGLASGSYPALFLSSFRPAEVLKGKLAAGMNSSPLLRKGLVVFQFTISIVLIICTWMVYNQLHYLKNKNLGFDKEHVLVIENTDNVLTPRLNTFRTELLKNSNVKQVAASFSVPGGLRPIVQVRTEDMSEEETKTLAHINIDFEYLQTLGIEMMEGRDFNPVNITDSTEAVILNKAALAELEIEGDPVGQLMYVNNFQTGEYDAKQIIGVIDNINFEPLYRKTEGAFFAPIFPFYNFIFVRIAPEHRAETIAFVENTWQSFVPDHPLDYSFLDENLNQLYLAEEKLGQLVTHFSILAVIVACLGLFGLASFATDQRRKEIGIRKVLGSSNLEIILLFFKEYAVIILIANIIAWPLAYYLTQQWMGNFVFNTGISWGVFFLTALLVLVVAIVTVSAKAIKASLENPVKSLRSE